MSGVSPLSSSAAGSQQYGTNVAPVSFPGIASGIDYNSIIQKYTALTLQQETPLQNKMAAINQQQQEILKIQDLLSKLQDTFGAISDPAAFVASAPTSSNSSLLAATSIPRVTATPGSYQVTAAALATSTQISSDPAVNAPLSTTQPLAQAGAAITPTNGAGATTGKVTIDGVAVSYNVNGDTIGSIVGKLQTAIQTVDPAASVTYSGGKVTISSTKPISLGAGGDSGNLLSVLRLDTAQPTYNATTGTYGVTSSANVGGINLGTSFGAPGNAGFTTAVTAGKFSINGVVFTVGTANNLNDVLNQINQSAAGVVASFDQTAGRVVLTAKTAGSQGITLGSSADTSNFLQSAGLLQSATTPGPLAAGATQTLGKSASLTYQDTSGSPHTVYSNSNTITNAIAGVSLTLDQNIGPSNGPVIVSVAQDSSGLQSSIKAFVTAYNAVIDEINRATQAPVVGSSASQTTGTQQSQQLTNGGVLWNNQEIGALRDRLVSIVSSLSTAGGSSSYNSLASIGLTLDSHFSVDQASASNASNSASAPTVTTQTFAGTSGRLNDLDVSKLTAALSANPQAVANLFTTPQSIIGQLGAYLTTATGLPTQLTSGIAGTIPTQSLFATIAAEQSDTLTSLQQQIKLVTDQANFQADRLRLEFSQSEGLIAQLQSQQSSLGALTAKTG